jgi:hypothetical protein
MKRLYLYFSLVLSPLCYAAGGDSAENPDTAAAKAVAAAKPPLPPGSTEEAAGAGKEAGKPTTTDPRSERRSAFSHPGHTDPWTGLPVVVQDPAFDPSTEFGRQHLKEQEEVAARYRRARAAIDPAFSAWVEEETPIKEWDAAASEYARAKALPKEERSIEDNYLLNADPDLTEDFAYQVRVVLKFIQQITHSAEPKEIDVVFSGQVYKITYFRGFITIGKFKATVTDEGTVQEVHEEEGDITYSADHMNGWTVEEFIKSCVGIKVERS